MTIQEQINADFMTAFKAKEMDKKNFLGVLKNEIKIASTRYDWKGEESVTSIVKKMEKSLKEDGRPDALAELEYLKPYLPQLMSEEQIREIVAGLVDGGANNIGAIMGAFNKDYRGQADNKIVSQIARELV